MIISIKTKLNHLNLATKKKKKRKSNESKIYQNRADN